MKTLTLFTLAMLFSLLTQAQSKSADAVAIEKQVDAMFGSWNRHNYSDMETYITPDCDWINIVGMWWKGAKEVRFAHQAFHDRMFKNTPMTKKSVKISLLSKDVALVHLVSSVGSFTTPTGTVMPEADDIATLVYVKKNGVWLLRAGENIVIDPKAQQSDPVKHMPK